MCLFARCVFAEVNNMSPQESPRVMTENTFVLIPIGNREVTHDAYYTLGLREKAPYLGLVALIGISVMILALRQHVRTHKHD